MTVLVCDRCGEEIKQGEAVVRVETGLIWDEERLREMPDFDAQHFHTPCMRPVRPAQVEKPDICRLCGNLEWRGKGRRAVGGCKFGLKGSSCGKFRILEVNVKGGKDAKLQ